MIFLVSRRGGNGDYRELLLVLLAANLADFDFIPGLLAGDHSLFHRGFSHSIPAALLFALVAFAACCWRRHPLAVRLGVLSFAGYASHLAVDWLTFDPGPVAGIPLLLPFSHEYFMADPTVFLNIERSNALSGAVIIHNFKAVLLELSILGPPALLLWLWNRKAAQR